MNDMTKDTELAGILDLKTLPLPPRPKVVAIRAEPYVDFLGADELRIWVVLDDSTKLEEWTGDGIHEIDRTINDALLAAGEKRFPYMWFRTRSQFQKEQGVA